MVPKLDFYIIDLGSFSKLHFDEVSLFQYAKVSEVDIYIYIYIYIYLIVQIKVTLFWGPPPPEKSQN